MPLSEESRAIRRNRISASEVAAVMGESPFMTPHELWALKTGLVEEKDLSDNHHVQRGIHLEPGLINWYREKTGNKVRFTGRHQTTHVHPTRDLCCATPDGLIGTTGTLEIKATWYWQSRNWGEQGTDHVPAHVLYQCLWQQGATGRTYTDAVGMTAEGDLGIWTVPFTPGLFFSVYEEVERWWHDYVVRNVPPPPDASKGCADTLLAQHPSAAGKDLIENDEEMNAKAFTLMSAHQALKQQEERYAFLVNEYKSLLGPSYGSDTPHGKVLWYNCRGKKTVNWKNIAQQLVPEIPDEVIEANTVQNKDYRVFRPYWKTGDAND